MHSEIRFLVRVLCFLVVGLSFFSSNVLKAAEEEKSPAQEEANAAIIQTEAKASGSERRFVDSLSVEFEGTLTTPSFELTQPSSPTEPSETEPASGEDTPRLHTENELGVGYKITDEITASTVAAWEYSASPSHGFEAKDPYLKFAHGVIVSIGNYSLGADLRLGVPVSEASRQEHLRAAFASEQVSTFAFPKSPLTAVLKTFIQKNFHGDAGHGKTFELHVVPSLRYQALTDLQAVAGMEYATVSVGESDLTRQESQTGLVFQPGVIWNILPTLTFHPHVHIRATKTTASTAEPVSFAAKINWVIL